MKLRAEKKYCQTRILRRAFKSLTEQKMQENILTDGSSSYLITKKFWAYLESKTKSSRIPEKVHLGETYRSETKEQADIFYEYFYYQFTRHRN